MNFEIVASNSIDIVRAWQATNADKEVLIVENTLGRFELWVACHLLAQLESFETAKRFAECACTFKVDCGTMVA